MTAPAPARPASLEQQVEIETPEQVVFSYTVAGIGSRAAAVIIDYFLMGVIGLVTFVVFSAVIPSGNEGARGWATALMIIFLFGLNWGYFVVFEAVWDGQTPGKRRLGLRVVQDGGYSVSFAASAVRNLARMIDMLPGMYAVGIASAAMSKSGKRLGDMLAGTIVVQEKLVHIAPVVSTGSPAASKPAPLTAALSDREYDVLERYIARRNALDPERRRLIAEQLLAQFRPHVEAMDGSPYAKLAALFESERAARARGVAARGATGAAREQHAIVARNAGRWSDFAQRLAAAQRSGLRHMDEEQVTRFVAEYREVATDLARLRTASAGRDNDALFYVSRLVGAGHNLIYRQRAVALREGWQYVMVGVPREVRRSWRPILLAVFLFFAPVFVTARLVIRDPQLADALLPAGMLDRVEEGVAREKRGEHEYVKVSEFQRPVMATAIIANNVQVTILAFASGLTAGVWTVLILVENGVSIGAVAGLYASHGIFPQLGRFVLPHSVLELSAICIAAGAAFLIAAAILMPGPFTRREAMVIQGRRAIRLMTATTLMLILAGTLEGLLSPRVDVPLWTKYVAAIGSGVLMLLYFTRGLGAAAAGPLEENAYSDPRALISR
jgi:uncharacterized membrane protein SpoIIM required for sporulation/uncharacterized RDD family membrane protein YckC